MPADDGHIRIELSDAGIVTLSVIGNPSAWAQTRLIILERAGTARLTGGERIEIPWWEFAPILPRLRTVTQLFPKLAVKTDKRTRELIERSNAAAAQIEDVETSKSVSKAQLLAALKAAGFRRKLTDNQTRNVQRLVALANGATFSVPGAGKTTEALATFAYKTALKKKLLVVCPKNAFAAWDEQLDACLRGFNVVRLTGGRAAIAALLERALNLQW